MVPRSRHAQSGPRTPRPARTLEFPSPELRQGLRFAARRPSSPAQRAETVRELMHEMLDVTTRGESGDAGPTTRATVAEAASCAAVLEAVGEHVDRMRRLEPEHPGSAPEGEGR